MSCSSAATVSTSPSITQPAVGRQPRGDLPAAQAVALHRPLDGPGGGPQPLERLALGRPVPDERVESEPSLADRYAQA